VVVPFSKMVAFFLYPGRLREVHKFRFYSSIACLAAVLGFVSLYPLPHYVWGNFVVRPCGQQQIVLNYPGRLMEIVTPEGSLVEPGQVIAVVENESLELEQIDWQVRCARLRRQLAAEKTRSSLEREASSRIGELATSLANAEQQLRLLEEQLAAMTLIAGQSGKLFPPRNRPSAPVSVGDLSRWSGTPLSGENRGGWFDANTVFGVIGDPQQMEAVIVIAQSDIQLVQPGQAVLAGCQQFTNQFLHAKIMSASQDELRQLPPELSQTNGGPIAAEPAEHGERPLLTAYTAVATFEAKEVVEQNIELLPGMRGQARILVGHASLAARLQRLLSSIIRFR